MDRFPEGSARRVVTRDPGHGCVCRARPNREKALKALAGSDRVGRAR